MAIIYDPSQIAAAYAANQPDIIEWMVKNDIDLPTESYTRQTGLLDRDHRTEDARIKDLRSKDTDNYNQTTALMTISGASCTQKPCVDKPKRLSMVANSFCDILRHLHAIRRHCRC